MKHNATIVFNRTCWTDNKLCSISVSRVMTSDKTIEVSFDSGIHTNEQKALSSVARKVMRWAKGRFFFTNLQLQNGKRYTTANNARAIGQQRVSIDSMPNVAAKASQARNGYKASNGKTYLAVEKMQGNQIRHSNTGLRYDNPFYQQAENRSKYASNYQQPDAWKWDYSNPNDTTSEKIR